MGKDGYSEVPQKEAEEGGETVQMSEKKGKLPMWAFVIIFIAAICVIAVVVVVCVIHFHKNENPEPVDGIVFDQYEALIVEDSSGLVSVYDAKAAPKKCLLNFTDQYMLEYGFETVVAFYEKVFERKIGHKVLADMDCSYHITSEYNISYQGGECPDLKNVTPPGIKPPVLTNCTKYEYIDDQGDYKVFTHFWVTGRRLVALEEYATFRGRIYSPYHQYFIRFQENKIPDSVFSLPKDILLVDLSKPYFPPDEAVPMQQETPIRKKAYGGLAPGKVGDRPSLETVYGFETEDNSKPRLINVLRPHNKEVHYEMVNGKLVRFVSPERSLPNRRSGRSALEEIGEENIPEEYNVGKEYGDKCPTTVSIFNQGQCGCCWAMAAATAFSDRVCIASKGAINVSYSTQYLVNCVNDSLGCNGGNPDDAWNSIKNIGIVTEECLPFTEHDGECHVNECKDPSVKPETMYLKSAYSPFVANDWTKNMQEIQAEIIKYGSVEACFIVLPDFMMYSRGVYRHKGTSEYQGGHCVKLLGWGVDIRDGPYWTFANSWGYDWGEDGYFRAYRGINDCGFEDEIVAGEVKI